MFLRRLAYLALTTFSFAAALAAQEPTKSGSRTEAFQKLRQARGAALAGETDKARQLVTDVRTWATARQDRLVNAWAEQLTGEFAFAAKQYDQAMPAFTAALAAFTALHDQPGMANCRLNLGRLAQATGKSADALNHQQAALQLYEKQNRPADTAAAWSDLGVTQKALGQQAEAKTAFQKALTLYRGGIKQPDAEVRVLRELAACCEATGEVDQALQHLTAALNLATELKDAAEQGRLHNSLGLLKHRQGALDEASKHYQSALQLFATARDTDAAVAATRNNFGALLQDQGKSKEAAAELETALAAMTRLRDTSGQARALYNLALVHESQGQEVKAVDAYERSLNLRRQVKDTSGAARILDTLALLYAAQGKADQAKTAREEAERLRQ